MNIKQIYKNDRHAFQVKDYSCGPVTLLNILRQRENFDFSEEDLIKLCQTDSKKGTTNDNLIKAAEKLGLRIIKEQYGGYESTVKKHLDQGHLVIVNYSTGFSGYGHYAQIAEYDSKAFYLRDCWLGYIRLEYPTFKKRWFGKDPKSVRWFVAIT